MGIKDIGKARYKITMKDGYIEDCYATQYDTARVFEFQVFNENQIQSIEDIDIKLIVEQKNKVVFANAEIINASEGVFSVTLNSEMLEDDSIHYAQIEMSNSQGILQSPLFKIKIGKSIKSGAVAGVNIVIDYETVKKYIDEIKYLRDHTEELKGDTPKLEINSLGNWVIDGKDSGHKAKGEDGKMSFEELTEEQKKSLKGEKGDSPYIKDGYWYVGNKNTNIKAQGEKGDKTTVDIKNGYWHIDGASTNQKAQGEKGDKPAITIENGYWFVDGVSTNQKAKGEDGTVAFESLTQDQISMLKGERGDKPIISIQDGYWFVDGVSTNQKAQGEKGVQGEPGEIRVVTQAQYNQLQISEDDKTLYVIKKEV